MKLNLLPTFILITIALAGFGQTGTAPAVAPVKKTCAVKRGDKAYDRFDFRTALAFYSKAWKNHKANPDTAYLMQHMADAYRMLNEPTNAELWYQKLVDKKIGGATNVYYLAEALRINKNYPLAKQYYQQYKTLNPTDNKNVNEILAGLENVVELSKDNGVFKIDTLTINTPQSEFGPAFYKDGSIFFTSNRNSDRINSNVSDSWSGNNFYQIYLATQDSGATTVGKVKKITSSKPNGKFHDGPVTFFKGTNELIFTRSNYTGSTAKTAGDHRTVKLKLYSMMYPAQKNKLVSLPFNNDDYSNAHPALSPDGKTLYFSSDRIGGQGGTDLYVTVRDQNGVWTEPKNLGAVINTRFDEKFPYIGYDGTLYYASNALDGLGGLDIYKTKFEKGQWTKPENLGAPVNSSNDDFTFIMDSTNKYGYFASNRPNGKGDDDIYHFTFDESKLDYKVIVKVVNATTNEPIPLASLGIDCRSQSPENTLVDKTGERELTLKGGKPCTIQVMNTGYKSNSTEVSYRDKNTTITVPLQPNLIKLVVTLKEKDSQQPIRDAALHLAQTGMPSTSNVTNENGIMQTTIAAGTYTISSPDYPSISATFSEKDIDPATGEAKLNFFVPREELIINVPLTANCFTNTITVTDLGTGEKSEISPNEHGEVRLDLKINTRYIVEHDGKADTFSTVGLKPGMNVEGTCKFYVGQTWLVRDIYYDFNKWNIRADAAKELDNLVRVMKQNPALEIELGSHTDCRASAKYNVVLSARRARSAVDYIVKKGIKGRRILAAGYGETLIINGCICEPTNESPCNESQHQANRRTEVKVLKY